MASSNLERPFNDVGSYYVDHPGCIFLQIQALKDDIVAIRLVDILAVDKTVLSTGSLKDIRVSSFANLALKGLPVVRGDI